MTGSRPLACRVFGHDLRFRADGPVLRWACSRCGGGAGEKRYADARAAAGYAAAFNRRDADDLGRRAPLLGMFPLRIWRRLQRSRSPERSRSGGP
jgi:hypothetical protein